MMNIEMAIAGFLGILVGVWLYNCLWPYSKLSLFRKKVVEEDIAGRQKEKHSLSFDFKTPMQRYLLESLRNARIEYIDRRHCPIGWNEQLKEILSFAIKIGVLPEIEVREILDKKLKRSGRACFEDHVNRGTYPDHTFWPEVLAYAIREGEFSTEEIERICFDHGYNATTFIKGYGENDLLEKAIKAFLPDPD